MITKKATIPVTLELGSIEGITFNVNLELVQIIENPLQNNIGREKDRYKNSVTHVESP